VLHTALCGVVEHWQLGVWFQNWGSVGVLGGVEISLAATACLLETTRSPAHGVEDGDKATVIGRYIGAELGLWVGLC